MTPEARAATTIQQATMAAAAQHGDLPAVVDGDLELDFQELLEAARVFGAGLVARELRAGDRVALWAPNSARWIIAMLGIYQAGCVLVPINTRFKGAEAADILERSNARALVTVTDFLGTDYLSALQQAGFDLSSLAAVVVAHGTADGDALSWDDLLDGADATTLAEAARRAEAAGPDDESDILFTSGTTGRAKGVVQTHSRTLTVATDWAEMTGIGAGDRYLMANPFFHMFGLKAGILPSMLVGATMYPEPVFDAASVLERIERERITVLPGAPTIYQSMLEHPDLPRRDLSSLRVAITGAADIPVELIRRVQQELPFQVLLTGYGLTEAGTASATVIGDDAQTVATTVGRPRPTFEIRIVDGSGEEVDDGETGEILVRGASVMSHYLDDPEATADALSPEGWLHTGDLGRLDDAGNLQIVGRSKDMFIVGGFNAYPAEIESMLLEHPAVADVAVIGIPDERLGEVGMAFVVPRQGTEPGEGEVIEWARDRMANYKAPRRVAFVEQLPINATGKVVKTELRALADALDGTEAPDGGITDER